LDSYKNEQTHFVSSLKKALESLEELTHVKYPKENFRKVKGAMKRKIFSLTDYSCSNISGGVEMIAQLKETFHMTRVSEKIQILAFLQLGRYHTRA
jgi:hypothetical protein